MKTINRHALILIYEEFMKIIKSENIEIAFEVFGLDKPLLYYSDPNLSKDKENWIYRKRNTVRTFSQSSLAIAEKNNYDIVSFCNKYGYSSSDYALVGGSIPITNPYGNMIGILTVTGLDPIEDDQLAHIVLKNVYHNLSTE